MIASIILTIVDVGVGTNMTVVVFCVICNRNVAEFIVPGGVICLDCKERHRLPKLPKKEKEDAGKVPEMGE